MSNKDRKVSKTKKNPDMNSNKADVTEKANDDQEFSIYGNEDNGIGRYGVETPSKFIRTEFRHQCMEDGNATLDIRAGYHHFKIRSLEQGACVRNVLPCYTLLNR